MDVYLTNTLLNLSLLYQSLFKTWSIQSLNQLTGEFYGYTAPMYIHISFGLRVLTPYKRTFNSCIFFTSYCLCENYMDDWQLRTSNQHD